MIILKLGGSVITDKSKKSSFNQKTMDRLAQEIRRADQPLILVHGAGSFGHILAKKYHLNTGYQNKEQLKGVCETQTMVTQLNNLVLNSLHKEHIPAVPLAPRSFVQLNNHQLEQMDTHLFESYLSKGFTPVTFGDVVVDSTLGFSICSGDLLIYELAQQFKPKKVIFVFDEDGLYTDNPKKNPDATLITQITVNDFPTLTLQDDSHDDVTQGMKGKLAMIKDIASLGIDTILVNGNIDNRVYHTLIGKKTIQTLVVGGSI